MNLMITTTEAAMEKGKPPHATKSAEPNTDAETPLQTHLSKALSVTNGSLEHCYTKPAQPLIMMVSYNECLKNHAASLGGVALDGCGEFMPTLTNTLSDPASLKCAACGCHRNFHRRDNLPPPAVVYRSSSPSPSSSSPASPTPQQFVYLTTPNMLQALSTYPLGGLFNENRHQNPSLNVMVMNPHRRKRARTKFTEEQKEKMLCFAEKLGWKMLRGNDEKMVQNFCSGVRVKRNAFKVWMHNNKHRRKKGDGHINANKNKISNINGSEERTGLVTYDKSTNGRSDNYDRSLDRYQIERKVRSSTTDGSSLSS